ncbi:MAG: hypothetical protein LUF04_04265 [Bacteroides sp.]|nr:hypothetical protein [Bacteroides sp.]
MDHKLAHLFNWDHTHFTPNNILLAEIETIKRESYLDDNVSNESIRTAMVYIQDTIVERVTGSCLMNQLKILIDCGEINARDFFRYNQLLDAYIFPILVNGVQSELTIHLTFKERNQGVVRNNDTELQYPALNEIKHVENKYRMKTDFYINRAVKWLRSNSCHFAELCGYCFCCDCDAAPFNTPYHIGINLKTHSNKKYVYDKRS